MSEPRFFSKRLWPAAVWLGLLALGAAATRGEEMRLETADTLLRVVPEDAGPRIVSIGSPARPAWPLGGARALPDFVEIFGSRVPVRWRYVPEASRQDSGQVRLVYESARPHLRLAWEWLRRNSRGPLEHTLYIENLEETELWLPLVPSLTLDLDLDPREPLEHVFVEKGAGKPSDTGTHRVPVPDGYAWQGFSTTYARNPSGAPREIIPFFLIERAGAPESGWYVGIESSARTRLEVARHNRSLQCTAGLNPEPGPFRTRLAAHETFETPTVFLGAFSGGPDAAGNSLRRWIREVLGHSETWKRADYPLTVLNSWGSGLELSDGLAGRMIRDASALGLEMFHMDAGWFRSVGDWRPDLRKFPDGLAAVSDDARAHGLKFGLWADWAQAGTGTSPGALDARDPRVRDWLVSDLPAGWQPEPFKGQTIDLGAPAARDWAAAEASRLVSDYRLDMLEHDGYLVAQGCTREGHGHAPPDPARTTLAREASWFFVESSNSTDVSYRATRAYYQIHSRLRREHPGLLLEACNDGGRMVDFGSAAHADYFSITDAYDPLSNRRAFYDASHVLPAPMLETYVERWPAPRPENFLYMLRSGMMGWFTLMQDASAWTDRERAAARKEIALYKNRLRGFLREADLYHISPRPDGIHWDGVEYFDAERGEGVVYAFRGSSALRSETRHRFVLEGLRPDRSYRLHFADTPSLDRFVSGRALHDTGLVVTLRLPHSSSLIFLRENTVR